MQENASDFYNRKYSIHNDIPLNSDDFKSEQIPTIFINQSNNIHIVAKYGQTVNLPCVIYKLKNQDLSQVKKFYMYFFNIFVINSNLIKYRYMPSGIN